MKKLDHPSRSLTSILGLLLGLGLRFWVWGLGLRAVGLGFSLGFGVPTVCKRFGMHELLHVCYHFQQCGCQLLQPSKQRGRLVDVVC